MGAFCSINCMRSNQQAEEGANEVSENYFKHYITLLLYYRFYQCANYDYREIFIFLN